MKNHIDIRKRKHEQRLANSMLDQDSASMQAVVFFLLSFGAVDSFQVSDHIGGLDVEQCCWDQRRER